MRGKIKMNSYIWLSLETLKEVEITKEGLVIHHHPDMCPYTTVTAKKSRQGQAETHQPCILGGSTWLWALFFEKNLTEFTVKQHRGKAMDWQLGQEGTWLISPIIQTLSGPHIPLHVSLFRSPLFLSGEQLFLQILTDINPRASGPQTEFTADLLVFCLLHLSLSSTISIPLTIAALCSCSRSMHHNSTGPWCLMSELWISFQPVFS